MLITSSGQMINQDISSDFPIKIRRIEYRDPGPILKSHWHEELMIFHIEKGTAVIHCNNQQLKVSAGDLIIINSNDIHYVENKCHDLIEQYIIVDFAFLCSSRQDVCQNKYITPLQQNRIRFQNLIQNDEELRQQVLDLFKEYQQKNHGYELLIKSILYRIFALLLRRHTVPPADELETRHRYQLRPILQYVDAHYDQKLTLKDLASMAHMSRHHFCRLFKNITGMPPIEYVNRVRIHTAMKLLQHDKVPINEVSQAVGIDDSNYFSRLFKKYKKISPSSVQRMSEYS
jgi:AraC-like DNA-binding protein